MGKIENPSQKNIMRIGNLSLDKVQRRRNELERRLAGEDGELWLEELEKFLERKECWVESLKNFFEQSVTFVLDPRKEDFKAEDLLKYILTKKEGGKIDFRDANIEKLSRGVAIKEKNDAESASLFRLKRILTNKEIATYAKKFAIYKKYDIFDACQLAGKLIDAGELKDRGLGVTIHLEEKFENSPAYLALIHESNGEMRIFLKKIKPTIEWEVGDGVMF
ncbi:MAG TPA: hypothetical protein VFQ59_03660 [Candidatus Paceibacterota bacterium]|nr:hypothetical protein [Candidatus Paceibacterota bacterium]